MTEVDYFHPKAPGKGKDPGSHSGVGRERVLGKRPLPPEGGWEIAWPAGIRILVCSFVNRAADINWRKANRLWLRAGKVGPGWWLIAWKPTVRRRRGTILVGFNLLWAGQFSFVSWPGLRPTD